MLFKYKLFTVLLALKTLFCSCDKDAVFNYKDTSNKKVTFKKLAKIDPIINESSGLAHASNSTFYTHNDGKDNTLYEINIKGELINQIKLPSTQFEDFEEMAEDSLHLYLGDFGNNSNKRKNLRIYKIERNHLNHTDTIQFKYEDQVEFPPTKKEKNFDCEAFIKYNDSLFLFSKNRGEKLVKLYAIKDQKGLQTARIIDSLFLTSQITSADLSPDKSKLALLAYGKIYIFELKNGLKLNNPFYCVKFPQSGQVEAILFLTNDSFLITNEGGKIFLGRIKTKKQH